MYPPEAIDFDGLPAATQARIRKVLSERERGMSLAVEPWTPRRVLDSKGRLRPTEEAPQGFVPARQYSVVGNVAKPDDGPLGRCSVDPVLSRPALPHHTQPEGGE